MQLKPCLHMCISVWSLSILSSNFGQPIPNCCHTFYNWSEPNQEIPP